MHIKQNYSLKPYNTFGLAAKAKYFVEVNTVATLQDALTANEAQLPVFILGGGSNLLLTKDLDFFVILNRIKGIEVLRKEGEEVLIKIGGGEDWHEFVLWCVQNDLGGIENLSLIPGTVGAAPIQNIGAYGVELKDVFVELEAVELSSGQVQIFSKTDCAFGYRDSIFKNSHKGKFAITKVVLKLRRFNHQINTSYGAIIKTLSAQQIVQPTIKDVSDAVITIRQAKLPDPKVIGNSGSFFKNPEIERSQFEDLQAQFPTIVHYDLPDGRVKIPAGWLIDQCGWKGKRIGNTGAYAKQALVLVNYGDATGAEVWAVAKRIQASVLEKYGIQLTPEVNVF